MKVLSKYLLPAALVAGFLFCFVQTVFFDHYPNPDDWVYDKLVNRRGVLETVKLLFKIDTGRWFSHLVVGISFYLLGHNFFLYGIYLSIIVLLFISSLAFIYKNYAYTFLHQKVSGLSQILFALLVTSTLFFLLFEGRLQSFGWVSSAINHLLSVTLCLFVFGMLFKETKGFLPSITIVLLSAFIGGSNEVNAVSMILCIVALLYFSRRYFRSTKLNRVNMVLSILLIALGLLLNMFSGGYEGRMNGLPAFTFYQSAKNTVHSFLMPLLHYMYLPLFLGALLIFILYFKKRDHHYSRRTLVIFGSVALVVILSFFLNCFLLSDVVPARAALWGYTLALVTLGLFLVSDKSATKPS